MTRLTRKDMQQQTRERLLAAAEREIARLGIQAASIRNIAESAGYSLGAFYSNFENKEAMLQELMALHMREEIRVFRDIVARTKEDSTDEMLAKISGWLKKVQENKNSAALGFEFQIYANRNPLFKKRFDEAKEKRQAELAEGLATLFNRRGLVPKIDPLQMAIGFAALWSGFTIQGSVSWAKPVDEVMLVLLKALLDNATPVAASKATEPAGGEDHEISK